ncbi:MAG: hypothetical protein JWL58_2857 [Streptosporangiaceae bacterium]|nr:hypothetical protein [Streptosporangiaceae bacterium]
MKPGQVIGPVPGFCLETGLSRERGHATFSEEPLPEDDDPEDDPEDEPEDEEEPEEPEEPEEAFEDEEPAESEELDDVLSEEAVADSDFVSAEAAAAELLLEPRLSVR